MDQEMDSLDSLLLSTSKKDSNEDFKSTDKQNPKPKSFKTSSFDFDEEDPLKDLFSDEDDDDDVDFTNNPKETANIKDISKDKNKIISSLFNIPEAKNSNHDSDDWLGLKLTSEPESQPVSITAKPKIQIEERSSPLHKPLTSITPTTNPPRKEISHSPIKIASKPEKVVKFNTSEDKKKSVLDDLFGDIETKPSKSIVKSDSNIGYVASVSKETKRPSRRNSQVFGDILESTSSLKPNVLESEKIKKIDSISSYSPSFTSEPRNSRRNSISSGDILDSIPNKSENGQYFRKNASLDDDLPGSNLPNWLGGSSNTTKQSKQAPKIPEKQDTPKVLDDKIEDVPLMVTKVISDSNQIETQMSASLLRQEGQLLAALQLKRQAEQMAILEKKQQQMILRQEKHLDELIKSQVQRQQDLEAKMQIQQEQIHNHIQALLSAPSNNIFASSTEIIDQSFEITQSVPKENSGRKNLEFSRENLIQNHEQEMELLENSYKKQISILENMLNNIETRLREECEFIEKEYKNRISKVEQHYEYILDCQKNRFTLLTNEKDQEIKQLKEFHRENLQIVQEQHLLIIEHFRKANILEQDVLKETTTNVQRFDNLVSQMNQTYQDISTIKNDLDSRHLVELGNKEMTIKNKDEEIKKINLNLEKQSESLANEKKSLNEKIIQLEHQLIEKNSELKAENWKLNQELFKVDALKESLENEKKQMIQKLHSERALFENQQKIAKEEQERISKQLEEEKVALSGERARIDTYARLQGSKGDVLINENLAIKQAKAEVEASLQVAEEATKTANEEREILYQERKSITIEKKRLEESERNLKSKAREIELLTREAKEVKEKGQCSLEEAKKMELTQIDRAAYITKQLEILAEREKKFLKEKAEWTKDNNSLKTNSSQKLCGYCKKSLDRPYVTPHTFNSFRIKEFQLDPQEVIQKLVAESEHFDPEDNSKFITSFQTASK